MVPNTSWTAPFWAFRLSYKIFFWQSSWSFVRPQHVRFSSRTSSIELLLILTSNHPIYRNRWRGWDNLNWTWCINSKVQLSFSSNPNSSRIYHSTLKLTPKGAVLAAAPSVISASETRSPILMVRVFSEKFWATGSSCIARTRAAESAVSMSE